MAKTVEINEKNVFSQGVLVCTKFYLGWGATAGVPEEKMMGLPKEIIRGTQYLLPNDDTLFEIRRMFGEAKSYIKRNSIPTAIPHMDFVPKWKIDEVDAGLKRRRERVLELWEAFLDNYEEAVKKYAKDFPEHYRPEKYPTKMRLESGFYFEWMFRVFTTPDKELKVISPEIYKSEVAKAKAEIGEMKEMTAKLVGNTLLKKIDSLLKQTEDGAAKQATLTSINNFLQKFDGLWDGFVGSKEVRKAVEDVRLYLEDTDASMLNVDEGFNSMVTNKMEKVVGELKTVSGVELKRSIDL
jgi:hypothetical protein